MLPHIIALAYIEQIVLTIREAYAAAASRRSKLRPSGVDGIVLGERANRRPTMCSRGRAVARLTTRIRFTADSTATCRPTRGQARGSSDAPDRVARDRASIRPSISTKTSDRISACLEFRHLPASRRGAVVDVMAQQDVARWQRCRSWQKVTVLERTSARVPSPSRGNPGRAPARAGSKTNREGVVIRRIAAVCHRRASADQFQPIAFIQCRRVRRIAPSRSQGRGLAEATICRRRR